MESKFGRALVPKEILKVNILKLVINQLLVWKHSEIMHNKNNVMAKQQGPLISRLIIHKLKQNNQIKHCQNKALYFHLPQNNNFVKTRYLITICLKITAIKYTDCPTLETTKNIFQNRTEGL